MDRLSGRGMKDWNWVHKMFPKWMIEEMDVKEWVSHKKQREQGECVANMQVPAYPDLPDLTGVASPSDPRRPIDYETENSSLKSEEPAYSEDNLTNNSQTAWEKDIQAQNGVIPEKDSYRSGPEAVKDKTTDWERIAYGGKRPPNTVNGSGGKGVKSSTSSLPFGAENKDWRQTALERRALSQKTENTAKEKSGNGKGEHDSHTSTSSKLSTEKETTEESVADGQTASVGDPWYLSSEQSLYKSIRDKRWNDLDDYLKSVHAETASNDISGDVIQVGHKDPRTGQWTHTSLYVNENGQAGQALPATKPSDENSCGSAAEPTNPVHAPDSPATRKRSTSSVLSQLPKDDIDFLSADGIRASMGRTKGSTETPKEKARRREELKRGFAEAHKNATELDKTIASGLLNEQSIRRKERELNEKPRDHPQSPILETSVDLMLNMWKKRAEDTEQVQGKTEKPSPSPQETVVQRRLEDEVESQKTAMRGLSDDGYSHSPLHSKFSSLGQFSVLSPLKRHLADLGQRVGALEKDLIKMDKEVYQAAEKTKQIETDRALVREVRKAYEDVYGPITVHHRQSGVEGKETTKVSAEEAQSLADSEPKSEGPQLDNLSSRSSVNAFSNWTIPPEAAENHTSIPIETNTEAQSAQMSGTKSRGDKSEVDKLASWAKDNAFANWGKPPPEATGNGTDGAKKPSYYDPSSEVPSSSPNATGSTAQSQTSSYTWPSSDIETDPPLSSLDEPFSIPPPIPTVPQISYTYKILAYDPATDSVITTTTLTPPHTQSEPITLADALSSLEKPAKFLPLLPQTFEPIASAPHLLIHRESESEIESRSASAAAVNPEPTLEPQEEVEEDDYDSRPYHSINPVDGTTRPLPEAATANFASPTGFVNYEDLAREVSRERLARMAAEGDRRREKDRGKETERRMDREREEWQRESRKKKGGFISGVVRTVLVSAGALWVGAVGWEVFGGSPWIG